VGYSRSNINDYLNGQNQVFNYPVNSPNYLNTFHFGINKNILKKKSHFLQVGLGIFGRGSKDFAHIIYPVDTVIVHQLYYASIPIQANLKLLNSKNIFFTFGFSPSYLLKQSKLFNVRVFPKANYLQFDYSIGVRTNLFSRLDLKVVFSQGLIKLTKRESNIEYLQSRVINHSFDFSLIYKL
jgi:hypothetical protein